MARPLWFVELLKKTFPRMNVIGKLSKVPIIGKLIDKMLFEGDNIMYLPRDQVIQIGETLDQPHEIVLPSQIVEHFINEANYHWIMNFCICRDARECKDYPRDMGCLFLGEAVLGINPQLGRRVSKEEAMEYAKKCREAGLVHLIGRNKLDAVWLNVSPGDKLLTICNCCPCCCLWRVLPHVADKIGAKITKMPGVSVKVTDKCIGCGTCTKDVCFVDAIHLVNKRAKIDDICRGCGRCVSVCPQNAIELIVESDQFVKKSIERITPLVDVS
jgi:ferredoxin